MSADVDQVGILREAIEHIFRDLCTAEIINASEAGQWPDTLWQALEDSGLTRALLPEEQGGSGLGLHEAVALLELAGYHTAPVPLAETWLAGLALSQAGEDVPAGPLTVAATAAGGGETLVQVPWGRCVPVARLQSDGGNLRLRLIRGGRVARKGANLAGEPSDQLDLRHGQLVIDATAPWSEQRLLALGALLRSAQMAGALRRCLELSCDYAGQRKQFGRPLAKFQAIQQQLALLAGEVAATGMAVETAAVVAARGGGELDIAVAKARAGMAVESATRISHQIHGAMGFSHEHCLHQTTRRLWAWRDTFGTECYWNAVLGRQALDAGGSGLWSGLITRLG
ncbi:MAG: acyl-CoA dehydrogenase family protein [Salinisphaera sp.]|nr:acyl-CoA dehydrogenase family protein [Salinisphaera sp.]